MRRLAVLLAVLGLGIAYAAPARATISIGYNPPWYGIAYSLRCTPSVRYGAWCEGTGGFWTSQNNGAWNQMQVCSDQLVTGGWDHLGCAWYPGSPRFSTIEGGYSPGFDLDVCNRWYTTFVFAKVLEIGGWYSGQTRAPGTQVRC